MNLPRRLILDQKVQCLAITDTSYLADVFFCLMSLFILITLITSFVSTKTSQYQYDRPKRLCVLQRTKSLRKSVQRSLFFIYLCASALPASWHHLCCQAVLVMSLLHTLLSLFTVLRLFLVLRCLDNTLGYVII